MNRIEIKFIDNGFEKYQIQSDTDILGRKYDNNATELIFIRPDNEVGKTLTAHITNSTGQTLDNPIIKDEKLTITNVLSVNNSVNIGFSFSDDEGYIKNSEVKRFVFMPAQKPDNYLAENPQITQDFFANADLEGSTLKFSNRNGKVLNEIDLPSGGAGLQGPKGDTGPQGIQGPIGPQGPPGESGTLIEIVQELGESTTAVMSQNAVTQLVGDIASILHEINSGGQNG